MREHAAHDAFNLLSRLTAGENHLGETLAQRAMMVNLGVAQIFVRQVAQTIHGFFHAQFTAAHLPEHFGNLFGGQLKPRFRAVSSQPSAFSTPGNR
jgi:hypothetical protein